MLLHQISVLEGFFEDLVERVRMVAGAVICRRSLRESHGNVVIYVRDLTQEVCKSRMGLVTMTLFWIRVFILPGGVCKHEHRTTVLLV